MKKISIPQPCTENWDDMTPLEGAKFCASCQTCVTDFSCLSDAEVLALLKSKTGKTCGRFKKSQLDRLLMDTPKQTQKRVITVASLALVSLLGFQNKSVARPLIHTNTFQNVKNDDKKPSQQEERTSITHDTIFLRGRVFDKTDNMPLVGCSVTIKGTKIGTVTDLDGNFELLLPNGLDIKGVILVASFTGFTTQEISGITLTDNIKIELPYNDSLMLGDMVIVGGYHEVSLWSELKSIFRNIFQR